MKLGIITYHRAHNYGAVLQCYALSKKLADMGHCVEVIDYYPTYFKEQYTSLSKRNMEGLSLRGKFSHIANQLLTYRTRSKRSTAFNKFIDNLPLSPRQYNEKDYNFDKYDAILFGSDQVWNPILTFGEDHVFSGNFDKQGAKFISYAASTSPKVYTNEYKEYFSGIIDRFDAISVREESLNKFLSCIKPGIAKTVLDPVLLLNKEEWSKKAIKPEQNNYLLIYTVPQSPKVRELANIIAKEKGLEIVEIRPNVSRNANKGILQSVSPEEFLGYFKYASYVVTTSFHGTAFSVKFQKQFSTLLLGTTSDDRATNLLTSIGLEHRLIPVTELKMPEREINYSTINSKLNTFIDNSVEFITTSLAHNEPTA